MLENNTKVSILLPVYNAETTIREAVESILAQSYADLEIIAIDDASKDKTFSLLRQLRATDKRIKLYKNKKRYGLAICLNRALKEAQGRFVAFMNANDLMHQEKLQRQVAFLSQNPKVVALGTQCYFTEADTNKKSQSNFPVTNKEIYEILFTGKSLQFDTVMLDRTLLPRDILKFQGTSIVFLPNEKIKAFVDCFIKLTPYGEFANIAEVLHTHRNPMLKRTFWQTLRLWVSSATIYNYKPSFRFISLFL